MPSAAPRITAIPAAHLQSLGAQLRSRRKALGVSAVVAAQAAGLSRVTLHRIEKGEPSVTMGAWCSAFEAVGLHLQVTDVLSPDEADDRSGWVPLRIALADYPQLRSLAWHVQGGDALTPQEAFDIYERNARHLNRQAMTPGEQALWTALYQAFRPGTSHV